MIEEQYFCYPKVKHTTESYTPPRLYTDTEAVYNDVSEHVSKETKTFFKEVASSDTLHYANKPGLLCPDHTTEMRDYSHSNEKGSVCCYKSK